MAEESTPKLSQADMVKQSLEKYGKDASPKAVQADVKERFGVEVRTKYVSMIKAEVFGKRSPATKKPAAADARKAKPQAAVPEAAAEVSPAAKQTQARKPAVKAEAPGPKPATANGQGTAVEMEDILAVKALVGRVGAEHLRTLIAAFES